ncbi:MAG TPA: c-type cytochrome [Vicinamibacterales bacterium]|jgi:mono/diheme cytochrome c family protein|nr:c-type cytochrome [Vicinamibacterales bacterium]
MNKTSISMVLAGSVFAAALTVTVGAQATRSTNEGVYSAEQATKGEAVYKENCAACHGDNLEGSGPMPPLAGKDFLSNWQGKTVGDLFEKTQTSMPATAPGTLTPEQASNLMAYLLSQGKYPAGAAALSDKMDDLKKISIDTPK